jgi:RNA-directed DNA polymerase
MVSALKSKPVPGKDKIRKLLGAERWRRREAAGDMIIVRYADDFIVGFEHETDARRFLDEMRERLQEFALSLHLEKTRLIEFGRFAAESRKRRGLGKPETFTFLGFTFICSKTRRGEFQVKRKSRRDRQTRTLRSVNDKLVRQSARMAIAQMKQRNDGASSDDGSSFGA